MSARPRSASEVHEVNTLNLENGDPFSDPPSNEETASSSVAQLGDFGIVNADGIYSAVRCGLCVNEVTNSVTGDTLLHAAAKQDAADLAIALLQSGADTRLRNRLGRSAADDAGPAVAPVLQFFQPCLPEALDIANPLALRQLCQTHWVNVHAVIRNGKNSLEIIAESRLPGANKCYRVLTEFAPLTSVMHALLAGDVGGLETALQEGGYLPPQDPDHLHIMRQCQPGPDGRTLVAVALDRGDIRSAKLLLEAGASSRGRQMAVSASEGNSSQAAPTTQSKPLAWSVLRTPESSQATGRSTAIEEPEQATDQSQEVAPMLALQSNEAPLDLILEYDPVALLTQRDSYSNTTLHAALTQNCEISKLAWLIERRPALLAERNSQAQCVRELAVSLYRQDALRLFEAAVRESIGCNNSLVAMLACRGHGDCCLKETRILADEERLEIGALAAVAAERGSVLEKALLCTSVGLNRIESIGRDHLRACADGNLKLVQKTNFAAFQEASTGCTGLIAAIAGEHLEVISYLLATRGTELTRTPDNSGRFPMHYVYALMQQEDDGDDDEESSSKPPQSASESRPQTVMARLISKFDQTCWTLEDSLGRKPMDMIQLGQSPEAKNMLWAGWMAGRSSSS